MNHLIAKIDFTQLAQDATPLVAGNSIGGIIGKVLDILFPVAGFVLLGMLMASGYSYMMSQGDPKQMAQAQRGITYAVLGFLIMFAAYMIVNLFGASLQIQQIKDIFG